MVLWLNEPEEKTIVIPLDRLTQGFNPWTGVPFVTGPVDPASCSRVPRSVLYGIGPTQV